VRPISYSYTFPPGVSPVFLNEPRTFMFAARRTAEPRHWESLAGQHGPDAARAVMGTMHSPRSGGAAGSEVCGATDKSAAEWLEAALLGNIWIESWISGLRRFVILDIPWPTAVDRQGADSWKRPTELWLSGSKPQFWEISETRRCKIWGPGEMHGPHHCQNGRRPMRRPKLFQEGECCPPSRF